MSCSPDASFVPENLDAADWSQLDPLYTRLLERELKCQNCLANLILDRSELDAAVSEAEANLYIETTRHTDDAEVQAAFERFVQNVEPHLKKAAFELDRKIAECPHADALDQDRYGVLLRRLRTNVGLFREANVPIETELSLLDQKYARTCGAMTVEFEGEEKTLPVLRTDRSRDPRVRVVHGRESTSAGS
jgi:oligoendopeptidase F